MFTISFNLVVVEIFRFSRRFPYTDSQSFSPCKHLQNVNFGKIGNMQIFFTNCAHPLTKPAEITCEDMFRKNSK